MGTKALITAAAEARGNSVTCEVGRNPCGRYRSASAPHWVTVLIVCVPKEKKGVVLGLWDRALDQLSP